jgi:PemK-like, MazF-like toxin of type II toxin-antitoxin system
MANRLGQLTRRRAVGPVAGPRPAPTPSAGPRPAPKAVPTPILKEPSRRRLVYAPQPNGRADPGEIVWTWVPFEEDPHRGKDRPVLVVGREGSTLEGLMLSSNSERDGQRHWFALGPGAWDREHRPSWVRLDRTLVVHEDGIRREGAVLDRGRFDAIAAELRRHYGWA